MSEMKHVAILRSGGRMEITLPLKPTNGMAGIAEHHSSNPSTWMWREDQNGVLINLEHVAAIVGAEPEQPKRLEHAFRSYAGGKYCAAIVGPHNDRHTCAMPPEMH